MSLAPTIARRIPVGRAVLTGGALGIAVLACTAPAWVLATTSTAVAARVPLAVAGAQAAPGVGAGGLVVLAAAGALALGGRAIRWAAIVGLALGGLLVVVSGVGALSTVQGVALAAARTATGVAVLDGPAVGSGWPWVATGLGAAAGLLAVLAGLAAPAWPPPGTRHEREPAAEATSCWDLPEPDDGPTPR